MSAETSPQAPATVASSRTRVVVVCAAAALLALIAAIVPPFAQPESYHAFADRRELLGIPNLLDVASNLAFLVVGLLGLRFVVRGTHSGGRRAFQDPSERWAWGVVFAAVALTCCGSSYYHLAPDSPRLAWDRLPMAIGFMAIVAAVVSERISARAGRALLVPLCLLGAATVWYWRWSAARGGEDLNPYAAVQFGSVLLILLIMLMFPARYTRSWDYAGAAALYALAKLAEHFDQAIFAATGKLVSGHTLKHLLAAGATFWLLRMLVLRKPMHAAPPRPIPA